MPNPFQPASGPLLPFAGVLGAATITRQTTFFPYPLLVPGIVNSSDAQADYHAMLLRVSRRLSRGLMLDATYTWSKNLEDTNTGIEDGQGFNAGGTATNWDINDRANNRMVGLSDVPHRLVALFLYEVPLSARGPTSMPMRIVKTIAGDWQISGTTIWQAGYPIAISGASTGAALARPDRVENVPLLLPEALWGWYDGRTQVTLPSGRIITPPNRTYLKYNPDAFVGRVVRTPNGSIVADQYWYGTASQTYDEIRTDPRFNLDISVRRKIPIATTSLEVGVDINNVLNHTQFSGAYTGNLGGTTTTANPALGLVPGMGNATNYGTRNMGTYNPRHMMVRATFRF